MFEGERCYETVHGPAIFRHRDHLQRLFKSAELYYMPIPYTLEELRAATHELIAANELRECYIRPIAFRGYGQMGLNPLEAPVEVSIAVWPWGAYLGEEGKRQGIRAKVSSWRRISHDSLIPHAKASGQYLNSVLAKIEATKAGYQEAILLDSHGFVCEGTGENIYVVRDGVISRRRRRPGSSTASIASRSSRSRATSAIEVVERDLARAELYLADEVFLSGTAAELVPVREIDDHTIGAGERRADHPRAAEGVRRRAARPRPALHRLARRRPGAVEDSLERLRVTKIELYDTTLRDGMQGEGMSLSAEEKLRVAHRLDELGIDLIEAGFPSSNPKELELFGLLAARDVRARAIAAFGMTRRRDVARRGRSGAAGARRLLRAGLHDRRQDVGAAPREGRQGRPRGEPADDRRVGRVPASPPASG